MKQYVFSYHEDLSNFKASAKTIGTFDSLALAEQSLRSLFKENQADNLFSQKLYVEEIGVHPLAEGETLGFIQQMCSSEIMDHLKIKD